MIALHVDTLPASCAAWCREELHVRLLRSMRLFAHLPRVLLAAMAPLFSLQAHAVHSVIVRQGAVGDRFYLLVKGRVVVLIATGEPGAPDTAAAGGGGKGGVGAGGAAAQGAAGGKSGSPEAGRRQAAKAAAAHAAHSAADPSQGAAHGGARTRAAAHDGAQLARADAAEAEQAQRHGGAAPLRSKVVEVSQLSAGQDVCYFGETALLDGVPRTASVVAKELCLTLSSSAEGFARLLELLPQLRERFEAARRAIVRLLDLKLSEEDWQLSLVRGLTVGTSSLDALSHGGSLLQRKVTHAITAQTASRIKAAQPAPPRFIAHAELERRAARAEAESRGEAAALLPTPTTASNGPSDSAAVRRRVSNAWLVSGGAPHNMLPPAHAAHQLNRMPPPGIAHSQEGSRVFSASERRDSRRVSNSQLPLLGPVAFTGASRHAQ